VPNTSLLVFPPLLFLFPAAPGTGATITFLHHRCNPYCHLMSPTPLLLLLQPFLLLQRCCCCYHNLNDITAQLLLPQLPS
jgi:hypothetical protein